MTEELGPTIAITTLAEHPDLVAEVVAMAGRVWGASLPAH